MRRARVLNHQRLAGHLEETAAGFTFTYDPSYLPDGEVISLTLPKRPEPYDAPTLFSFSTGYSRKVAHGQSSIAC